MLLLDTHQIKRRQKSRPHAALDKSFYNMRQKYLNGPAFSYNIINKNSGDLCVLFLPSSPVSQSVLCPPLNLLQTIAWNEFASFFTDKQSAPAYQVQHLCFPCVH